MGPSAVTPPASRRWVPWAVALGLASLFLPGWWRAYQLTVRAERLDAEIAALDAENQRLLTEMHRLQYDPDYIERVARKKLGRVRKGEILYKVAPPEDPSTSTSR
ncbi:MAG: hypothetical protein A3C53_08365 [Omnitrophica WOR_2 bacterium RIFCSPHIGHO2_02_FULL_68_15]|nr:MAG: hypothetical protein A3C53_08365 [Omnitrophica WOR_2 bacterium RIFCSPHIGHO2_02_FULL_68_15]